MTLGFREHRHCGDALAGIGNDAFQQCLKVSCHPFDCCAIKYIRTVLEETDKLSLPLAQEK